MKDPDIERLDERLTRTTELMAEMREEGRRHAETTAGIRDVQRELILDMREFREEWRQGMRADREEWRAAGEEWRAKMRADREEARKEAQLHHEALQQTNESMALMLDELRSWGDRRN